MVFWAACDGARDWGLGWDQAACDGVPGWDLGPEVGLVLADLEGA